MSDFITTRKCDGCGSRCSGVLMGTNSFRLFHCKMCDPTHYEEVAQEEKNRWLAGQARR